MPECREHSAERLDRAGLPDAAKVVRDGAEQWPQYEGQRGPDAAELVVLFSDSDNVYGFCSQGGSEFDAALAALDAITAWCRMVCPAVSQHSERRRMPAEVVIFLLREAAENAGVWFVHPAADRRWPNADKVVAWGDAECAACGADVSGGRHSHHVADAPVCFDCASIAPRYLIEKIEARRQALGTGSAGAAVGDDAGTGAVRDPGLCPPAQPVAERLDPYAEHRNHLESTGVEGVEWGLGAAASIANLPRCEPGPLLTVLADLQDFDEWGEP